jgi:hypothetical protein
LTAVGGKDDLDALPDLQVVWRDVLLAGVLGSLISFEFGSAVDFEGPSPAFSVLDEDKREVGVVFDAGNPAFGDPRNKERRIGRINGVGNLDRAASLRPGSPGDGG